MGRDGDGTRRQGKRISLGTAWGLPAPVTLVSEGFVPKGVEVSGQHPDWLNGGKTVMGMDPDVSAWRVWAGCKHLPAPSFPVLGAPRALGNASLKAKRGEAPFLLFQPCPCTAFRAQQDLWHSHSLDNWRNSPMGKLRQGEEVP